MQMYHLPNETRLGLYQYLLCEIIITFSFLVFSLSKLWDLNIAIKNHKRKQEEQGKPLALSLCGKTAGILLK